MRPGIPLWVIAFWMSSQPVCAQGIIMPGPGDRVRVTAGECAWSEQEATFLSLQDGLLTARVNGRDIGCPSSALTGMEVARGERKWWQASLVGMGIGGVLVALVGAGMEPDYASAAPLAGVILGMPAGFLVGTAVGLARGSVDWQTLPLPALKPHLLSSASRDVGLGFSIPLRR